MKFEDLNIAHVALKAQKNGGMETHAENMEKILGEELKVIKGPESE